MLEDQFLKPLGLTKYRLAKDIGVPAHRIGEIVSGKHAVTANTELRLCRYFGLNDGWRLRGQVAYDIAICMRAASLRTAFDAVPIGYRALRSRVFAVVRVG